jgi:hypothetical protein
MRIGIYDHINNCWLGDKNGLFIYNNTEIAKLAIRTIKRWGYNNKIEIEPYKGELDMFQLDNVTLYFKPIMMRTQ